jgi:putative intracellular protease/amidase
MLQVHADFNSRDVWAYALAFIVLATILVAVLRRRGGSARSGPQALIVLSSQGFPVGSAAAAVTAFRTAGLQIVMSTREGGKASPEVASLQTKEAIAASQEGGKPDPVWLWVLRTAQQGVRPFAQCKPEHFLAVYVTGGPAMLQDLMSYELSGRTPTPFCEALRSFCADVAQAGGVVGAAGHGTHALPPHTAADATDAACSWQGRLSSSNLDSGTADTVAAMVRGLPVAHNEKQDGGGSARSKSE